MKLGEGAGAKLGAPGPGLKPPLDTMCQPIGIRTVEVGVWANFVGPTGVKQIPEASDILFKRQKFLSSLFNKAA